MIDTERMKKLKKLAAPGCVYVGGKFYHLEITDKDGKPVDIQAAITKLGKKALIDCTKDNYSIIGVVVRQLAIFSVKSIAVSASFNPDYLEKYERVTEGSIIVSPLWEMAAMGFIVGYLTSNFVRKNDIQLRPAEIEATEEEKETILRISHATAAVDIMIVNGVPATKAYAHAIVEGLIREEDLQIIASSERIEEIIAAAKEITTDLTPAESPNEFKN